MIPKEYKQFWKITEDRHTLIHITTIEGYNGIMRSGFIQPNDPSECYWSGLKAVFMTDPYDAMHLKNARAIMGHIRHRTTMFHGVILTIRTNNVVYKCLDETRTNQVISLEPVSVMDIFTARTCLIAE